MKNLKREKLRRLRVVGFAVSVATTTLLFVGWVRPAGAQDTPVNAPQEPAAADAPKPTGFWERDSLTGDWGGVRSGLEDAGIKFGATETSDVLADIHGGAKTGATYEGATQLSLDLDLDKLADWTGATVHVVGWQIHGRGLSGNDTRNLLTLSSIEADRGSLLGDFYLDQSAFDGMVSLRIGQQAVDDEFIVSKTAGLFVNSTFGYPGLPSYDQPSGGPDYPFATPGVRLKLAPTDQLTILAGAFNGDPAGPGDGDPQVRDPAGTSFRTSDGVLGFLEAQYAVNQAKDAEGLPGTYKLGAWFNSDRASIATTGAARHDGDWSLYAVADQMLWRRPGTDDQGLSVFARIMGAPADRNLIDLYADGGVSFKGPFEGRDDDQVGLAVAYGRISDDAGKLPDQPGRDYEGIVELTYQAPVTPWWQFQPDVQYVLHPGGRAALPSDPGRRIPNATVVGLRTVITF